MSALKAIGSEPEPLKTFLLKFDKRISRAGSTKNTAPPEQIELWPDGLLKLPANVIAGPKDISNSAIFTVRNKRMPRASIQNVQIFALGDIEITYTGIELRAQDDELVWLQIIDLAKSKPLETWVNFTPYQLCKAIGWATNGSYYKKIHSCMLRLKATAIQIRQKTDKKGRAFSMISDFEWQASHHRVKIPAGLQTLFMGDKFSHLQWAKYRKLTPIARRLYDYAASHRFPHPLKLDTFRSLCNSEVKNSQKWKQQLQKACRELVETQLLKVASIEIINCSELVHFKR